MTEKSVDMDTMPLRAGHFRVLAAASLGQLTGGALSTLIGIVLPMIQIIGRPHLSPMAQGAVAGTSLVGIMLGSIIFGQWSDRKGYLLPFRLCPAVILAASLLAYFSASGAGLVAGLFFMGIGIGGEYSLDSDYISEIMPEKWRLTMVGCAKAATSVGNAATAAACFFLLGKWDSPAMWNRLFLLVSGLAAIMLLCRVRFAQSPGWLMVHGREKEAEKAARYFLGNDVLADGLRGKTAVKGKWSALFAAGNMKKVIFSGIPWACEGVGVYGIGVFMPALIMALGLETSSEGAYQRITESVRITAVISLFILAGFVAGIAMLNRVRHLGMQSWGFVLSAAGIGVLLASHVLHLPLWVSVLGFVIFELFLNAGPHLTTFVIPPQIYSVQERGAGTGIAAAFGKLGAVIGVLFMPVLLEKGGMDAVLWTVIAVLLAGAAVSAIWGRRVMPRR